MTAEQFTEWLAQLAEEHGAEACWPWPGARNARNYGQVRFGGRLVGAHRLSLHLAGDLNLDDDAHALHHCDNPPCVNPAHLRAGSRSDNMQDALARGRWRPGGEAPPPILSAEQVAAAREARAAGFTLRDIAIALGVSRSTLHRALHGDPRAKRSRA